MCRSSSSFVSQISFAAIREDHGELRQELCARARAWWRTKRGNAFSPRIVDRGHDLQTTFSREREWCTSVTMLRRLASAGATALRGAAASGEQRRGLGLGATLGFTALVGLTEVTLADEAEHG